MRRQPYPVAQMTGGLDVSIDPVFLVDKNVPSLSNVRFHQGLIKKDFSWIDFGNVGSNEYIVGLQEFAMKSGDSRQLCMTPSNVYIIHANKTFSALNANTYSGNEYDMWDSICVLDPNGNEAIIFTNGVDPIQKWDGISANCENLSGWGTVKARYINTFKSRLFVGYVDEGGTINSLRVKWSVAGNIEDHSNTGSGFVDIYDGTDIITGLWSVKNKLLVFRQESIWEMVYVGGNAYFQPVKLVDSIGCIAPRSVGVRPGGIIFLGPDNVYNYDGVTLTPLADVLSPLLFEAGSRIINANAIHLSAGIYVNEIGQYWLSVPTKSAYPDTVFKYDFATQSWTSRPEAATAYGWWYSGVEGTPWNQLPFIWQNWPGPWIQQYSRPKTPTILKGSSNGVIEESLFTTGSNDTGYIETKDWTFGHACRILELRVQANGGPFRLSYSTDQGKSWSPPANFAPANGFAEYRLLLNLTTQHIRARVESDAANFELKWIEPWFISRVRSKSTVSPT